MVRDTRTYDAGVAVAHRILHGATNEVEIKVAVDEEGQENGWYLRHLIWDDEELMHESVEMITKLNRWVYLEQFPKGNQSVQYGYELFQCLSAFVEGVGKHGSLAGITPKVEFLRWGQLDTFHP